MSLEESTMKAHLTCSMIFLALVCCTVPAFSQNRFDVALEGPWIFYQERNFKLKDGVTSSTVLVAIAPTVPGHHGPVFTSGDGGTVNEGIYCVGFDGACTPNLKTSVDWDSYNNPSPVGVQVSANWHWDKLSKTYAFVFPLPDSYSADGQYATTFQSSFPSNVVQHPPTVANGTAIGVHLHYSKGPKSFNLLPCSGGPSVAACSNASKLDQANSGTLRISIKSHEDAVTPGSCDYHVHRAYHRMTKLIELNLNTKIAYTGVPDYNDTCVRCDPQQDFLPEDCASMGMAYSAAVSDVPEDLNTLVTFLKQLSLDGKQSENILLPKLDAQATSISGKFPTLSQLVELESNLQKSGRAIHDLLVQMARDERVAAANSAVQSNGLNLRLGLEVAQLQERTLVEAAGELKRSGTSGKDCRAPAMWVQQ
jgi:hypothetical protein